MMSRASKSLLRTMVLAGITWTAAAAAHEGRHAQAPANPITSPEPKSISKIQTLQESYRLEVQPIFDRSCMDCHSARTRHPWYYKIPGIKQLIDSDIAEARKHIDFSSGFPFQSHATPIEDLDAIAKSVQENDMPPFAYRLFHLDAALNEQEKRTIVDWTSSAKKAFE